MKINLIFSCYQFGKISGDTFNSDRLLESDSLLLNKYYKKSSKLLKNLKHLKYSEQSDFFKPVE